MLNIAKDSRIHFVAVSEAIKERALEFGLPSEKIEVKYIGIDTEKFCEGATAIDKREKQILFVGRLTEKKG